MTGKEKEITSLFGQHDAIRAQMKFLTNSLQELAAPPNPKTGARVQTKEWLQSYCFALRDLRDGIYDHIELDERIFKALSPEVKNKSLSIEHKNIKLQIDQAVQLVEDTMNTVITAEELQQRALEITSLVEKIRKLIQTHTTKEDKLLKPQD